MLVYREDLSVKFTSLEVTEGAHRDCLDSCQFELS